MALMRTSKRATCPHSATMCSSSERWGCKDVFALSLGVFVFIVVQGILNGVLMMGMSYMVYNITPACLYDVTQCTTPKNKEILGWSIAASSVQAAIVVCFLIGWFVVKWIHTRYQRRKYDSAIVDDMVELPRYDSKEPPQSGNASIQALDHFDSDTDETEVKSKQS